MVYTKIKDIDGNYQAAFAATDAGDMTFTANWSPVLSIDMPVQASDSTSFAVDAITGRTMDAIETDRN